MAKRLSVSCSIPSRFVIRSFRASNFRSAIPASFFKAEFCSTSYNNQSSELKEMSEKRKMRTCFCTSVSCSRLRSKNAIFFCWALVLLFLITLLYCSFASSNWISNSTTYQIDSSDPDPVSEHSEVTDLLTPVLQVSHQGLLHAVHFGKLYVDGFAGPLQIGSALRQILSSFDTS